MTDQAWAYYSSAGDDEITKHQNRSSYSRIWFKPRILRSVGTVDASSSIIKGKFNTSLPVYISPAAMAKLGHPDGELNLTRAAGKAGIVQGISANASVSLDEMLDARADNQPVFYQLYVNKDRSASERILQKVQEKGVSAIMLTVDAPVMGNRERDMRAKGEVVETGGGAGGETQGGGVAQAISGYIDPDLVSRSRGGIPFYTPSHLSIMIVELERHCLAQTKVFFTNHSQGDSNGSRCRNGSQAWLSGSGIVQSWRSIT